MFLKVDPNRFADDVKEIESHPVTSGKVMLYGSSFFAVWGYARSQRQLGADFVNHGFGGSTGEDQLYYYNRLVRPYAPRAMIMRGGLNDLNNGYSPQKAAEFSIRIAEWAKNDFPDFKCIFLSAFDYKSAPEAKFFDLLPEYNRYLREYSEQLDFTEYLDISEFFYKSPEDVGSFKNFRDVFVEDGLHLSDKGYDLLTPYFIDKIKHIL